MLIDRWHYLQSTLRVIAQVGMADKNPKKRVCADNICMVDYVGVSNHLTYSFSTGCRHDLLRRAWIDLCVVIILLLSSI
jgi:hypothetical protein